MQHLATRYLGSIGGPAAILAQNNIKSIECVEYPELGMEAIWKIEATSLWISTAVSVAQILTQEPSFVAVASSLKH